MEKKNEEQSGVIVGKLPSRCKTILERNLSIETIVTDELSLSSGDEDESYHDDNDSERTNINEETKEVSNGSFAGLGQFFNLLLKRLGSNSKTMCSLWQKIQSGLTEEGEAFRSLFLEDYENNMHDLKSARLIFHCCMWLPMLLYYNKSTTTDCPPKFPATISYTVRRGYPQRAQMITWLWAWLHIGRIIRRTRDTGRNKKGTSKNQEQPTTTTKSLTWLPKFFTKMVGTGIWTLIVFRLGQGTHPLWDIAHFAGAAVYMVDSLVMFRIFNIKSVYRKAFVKCLALLTISLYGTRAIEILMGLPTEAEMNTNCARPGTKSKRKTITTTLDREQHLKSFSPYLRRLFVYLELLLMVSENLLFATFIQGMPSGIEEEYKKWQQQRQQQQKSKQHRDNEEEEEAHRQ